MWKRVAMRGYQNAATQFVKDVRKCALFIDAGLGKTISVLSVIRDLQASLDLSRVLVVGPPRVARKTWPDEIKEWEHTRPITYTSLQAPTKIREKRLREATDVHLISCDLVPWLDRETCGQHDYDMIAIDESSFFKNQSAKRWKAMRRLVAKARYIVLMTGTPAANGLQDLWGQIFLLDGGARLGHTETDFRQRYFDQGWGEHSGPEPKSFAETKIKERIADICFTLLDKDYAELPPRLNNKIVVDLTPEMMKLYKKFEREYVLDLIDGDQVTAISAGALTQKLQQVANGIVLREGERRVLHREKMDALHELVEESSGQSIIVAYSHISDKDAILREFPNAVLLGNKNETIDQWNAGKIPMLVAHPKSCGHGLNLQFGGNIIAWYGLTWSLELYLQLNKRLHRSGQTRTTVVHHIIAAGTIDETIMEALTKKDQTQNRFKESMRRIIEDIVREVQS